MLGYARTAVVFAVLMLAGTAASAQAYLESPRLSLFFHSLLNDQRDVETDQEGIGIGAYIPVGGVAFSLDVTSFDDGDTSNTLSEVRIRRALFQNAGLNLSVIGGIDYLETTVQANSQLRHDVILGFRTDVEVLRAGLLSIGADYYNEINSPAVRFGYTQFFGSEVGLSFQYRQNLNLAGGDFGVLQSGLVFSF